MENKLLYMRQEVNLTHEEIARKVGISRSFYSQIEKGTRNPSTLVLLKITKFFNRPVEEIFLLNRDTTSNKNS